MGTKRTKAAHSDAEGLSTPALNGLLSSNDSSFGAVDPE